MATNNSINLSSPTSTTLDVTTTSGQLKIETTLALQTDTGFATWTGSGAYFDDTTIGSFQLLRGGTGYIRGKYITWSAPQTVTGLTAGNCYYIYVDSSGIIGANPTRSDSLFLDNICLFECTRDSTLPTNNQITVKENHPYDYPALSSNSIHNTIGCIIRNQHDGARITKNGTRKIQINGSDLLDDHGLYSIIPDSGGVAETFYIYYTNASGRWCQYKNTDTFEAVYNKTGTVTALSPGYWSVFRLYVSKESLNSSKPLYFAIIDTVQYPKRRKALSAIADGNIALATHELYFLEMSQLGYILFKESSNSINRVIINKNTFRKEYSSGGTNIAGLTLTDVTEFNQVLSSDDSNSQACFETLDEYTKSPKAYGDDSGLASTTALTNVTDTSLSSGALSIKSKTVNSGSNAGFIKMYVGTTAVWVPYFTDISP
jgi:hypothetical protein